MDTFGTSAMDFMDRVESLAKNGFYEEKLTKSRKPMNFYEYQQLARTTAIYPKEAVIYYPALGLAGEVGEVCEKIKKHIRDGRELDKDDLTKELGDVLWYLSALSSDLGINLDDVAQRNYEKLKSRQERDVLHGSGDNR